MKTIQTFKTTRFYLFITLLSLVVGGLAPRASAKIFDGGVDSENLGKGDWLWIVGNATNHLNGHVNAVNDIPSLMSYFKNQGIKYIIVKAGTGSTNYNGTGGSPQFN